jgi:hypothetical protein
VNLLVPPLVAAVALSVYVATLSKDRTDGDDRRMAADSLVRFHEAAVGVAVGLSVDSYPYILDKAKITGSLKPFVDVPTWKSVQGKDTEKRIWVMTYPDGAAGSSPTAISDSGVAGIPLELQRLSFSSGTYGFWKSGPLASTGTLASTIGPISFSGPLVSWVPDGAIMVATLCKLTPLKVLDCGPIE